MFPASFQSYQKDAKVVFSSEGLLDFLSYVAINEKREIVKREISYKFPLFKLRPSLTLGAVNSHLLILNGNISGNPYYNLASFPVRTKPVLGIGAKLDILRVSHLSVNVDVLYRSFDWTEGYYREDYAGGNYREIFIDYSMRSLRAVFSLTKGFEVKGFIPYLRVGAFGGRLSNMQGSFNDVLIMNGSSSPGPQNQAFGVVAEGVSEIGYVLGAEIAIRSFALEGRMERSSGFSGTADKSFSAIRCISIVGQYRF